MAKKKKWAVSELDFDDGLETVYYSPKDIAPVKKKSVAVSDLRKQKSDIESQLTTLGKTAERTKWWDSEDNLLENAGNVLYKLFAEKDSLANKEDKKKRDQLVQQKEKISNQIEDTLIAEKDKNLSAIDKIGYTITGNVRAGLEGIESTTQKILGQTPKITDPSYEEKLAQVSRQQTKGVGGVGLDILGSVSRQIPSMLTGSGAVNSALAFANYGGGAYNEAKRDGASEERATIYGTTIGSLETLLNKLLPSYEINGKNVYGNTATGKLINNVMSKISNNAFIRKTLTNGTGEFTEEYLQKFLEPIVKNTILEEDNGADFWNTMKDDVGEGIKQLGNQLFNKENLYAGALGFATSGLMGAQSNYDAYKYEKATGRNADTGLTQNEQTVLDSETSKRKVELQKEKVLNTEIDKQIKSFESTFGTMTEAEKKGIRNQIKNQLDNGEIDYSTSKLSKKEVSNIENQVKKDLQKGNIEIDSIENTLFSEKKAQIKELQSQLDKTTNETEKAEIQAKIDEIQDNIKRTTKEIISKETYIDKDGKIVGAIAKSYNEANKKNERFTYETKTSDSEQKKVLAEEFKTKANNTTKSHETFEMLSKLSNDKGVQYHITNNEEIQKLKDVKQLKNNVGEIEGYVRVNTDGSKELMINVDSDRAINRIVGHETTHLLQGTKEFDKLVNFAKEYATTKGEYDTRLKNTQAIYEGVNADIDNEVTANIVGDYLFTDSDFVNKLSVEQPTVFQKVYNEIKHLYKLATAGSKEARDLERLKKSFDKAYKQNVSNTDVSTENDLTKDEQYAVNKWAGFNSYAINETLRNGNELSSNYNGNDLKKIDEGLSSALNKLPEYKGTVHRSIEIPKENLPEFLNKYKEGSSIVEHSYISASNDGIYDDSMNVQITIESKTARDTSELMRQDEHEVMFPKDSSFEITNVDSKDPNNIKIEMKEILQNKPKIQYSLSENDLKNKQNDIIQKSNPAEDDYHTWIRSANDIKTFEETLNDNDYKEYYDAGEDFDDSYTADMAKKALDTSKITVYSSYPIENGVFVSPSQMEASQYAGGDSSKLYSKEVNLTDIAWIDPTQGQYAKVEDTKYSLSNPNEEIAPTRDDIYGEDIKYQEPIIQEDKATQEETKEEELLPLDPEFESKVDYSPLTAEAFSEYDKENAEAFKNISENDINPEQEQTEYDTIQDSISMDKKYSRLISKNAQQTLALNNKQTKELEQIIISNPNATKEELHDIIEKNYSEINIEHRNDELQSVKNHLRMTPVNVSEQIKNGITDYGYLRQKNFNKIRFSKTGQGVDQVYQELNELFPGSFPEDITNPTDQLLKMVDVANEDVISYETLALPKDVINDATSIVYEGIQDYKHDQYVRAVNEASKIPYDEVIPDEVIPEYDVSNTNKNDKFAPIVEPKLTLQQEQRIAELNTELDSIRKSLNKTVLTHDVNKYKSEWAKAEPRIDDIETEIENIKTEARQQKFKTLDTTDNAPVDINKAKQLTIDGEEENIVTKTKKELRKALFSENKDFIVEALDNAKNRSMAFMNNTDTIRNTELVFGRDAGNKINKIIFQKAIDNESDSIKWQNQEREDIKDLGIKARSKESAAVQKWGEKQYVNDYDELVPYGENNLTTEFPDVETQNRIKRAADIIRSKYDTYIDEANNVLTKLGFDPIKKRPDYMRHFQELNDVFSRFGIPFNAKNMTEHSLPTDINGLTEYWSPQKNYFANMQPRKGVKTNYDAITGIDGYIGGIANLIHHTEDIQRGRAFEELIRETYGEDKGWENLELLPDELKLARAEKIQDNHLSNYAAWVHEWTNNIAGKKNKIDRSIEAMFGRKAFTVLDEVRKQVGSNMIGFNLSSSLTNLIAPVQAMAKTNKLAVVKGTADTIKNIFIKDSFSDRNKFLVSRMGSDMISKNPWQKVQDAGFVFMKGLDWFSSNQIVRSKYYELRSKGMSEAQASDEAGKFAARILGDRTKGANAQLYNSKLIGVVTQFQLEVNNQLYSQFYDTYHESKEAAKGNALKTAAGLTFTLGQLAAFTHLFGQTFEAIAGYNPTMDIVEMIKTALGLGDDDDDKEKPLSERLKKAADMLVDSLPYVNILTGGGRIPIASGIPNLVGVATGAKDQYGNEMTLDSELKKLLYLIPPTGGNQVKKTTQGLGMFDEDLPVSGSYTDSGNLRFPVEDTLKNRIQAGVFGQYANENASNYFDNKRMPLKEKQIEEYKDLDMPIKDYWKFRDGLKDKDKVKEKIEYINKQDFTDDQKNILANNVLKRDYDVDMSNYDDYGSYEEFDYSYKNPEKYQWFKENNISYDDYVSSDERKEVYNYAYNNPETYKLGKAITDDFPAYYSYKQDIADITADKDSNGNSISGSKKAKVINYVNSLSLSIPQKAMLIRQQYSSFKKYNNQIVEYVNNLNVDYSDKTTILDSLDMKIDKNGKVYWK